MKLDPLRVFSLSALAGDLSILLSGGMFLNPLRMSAASLGFVSHGVGAVAGSDKKISLLCFKINSSDFVLGITILCGFIYFLSGSNIFGFENAARYSEMILGVTIMSAAASIMSGRKNLGMALFLVGPLSHLFQVCEVYWVQGRFDVFQLSAALCFLVSGIASRFIHKNKSAIEPADLR